MRLISVPLTLTTERLLHWPSWRDRHVKGSRFANCCWCKTTSVSSSCQTLKWELIGSLHTTQPSDHIRPTWQGLVQKYHIQKFDGWSSGSHMFQKFRGDIPRFQTDPQHPTTVEKRQSRSPAIPSKALHFDTASPRTPTNALRRLRRLR